MQISINGEQIGGFLYASVSQDFTTAIRHFMFTSSSKRENAYPVKRGDSCQIIVENQTVMDGFVDTVIGNYSASQDTITVSGRSKMMDIVDSTIDYTLFSQWKGDISLVDACKEVIKKLNLKDDIKVIVDEDVITQAQLKIPIDQYLAAQNGESAFGFLEKYAQILSVLLSTDNDGTLIITSGGNTDSGFYTLINKITGDTSTNNVIYCRWMSTEKNLFNKYVCWSQLAQAPVDFRFFETGEGESDTVKQNLFGVSGDAFDQNIRTSRQNSFVTQVPLAVVQCPQRALWQANYNRALSQSYSPAIQGHTIGDTNDLWEVNRLIQIVDERADINSEMFIKSINFIQSLENGNITELVCVAPDSFQLKIEVDYYQAKFADTQANYDILRNFGKANASTP